MLNARLYVFSLLPVGNLEQEALLDIACFVFVFVPNRKDAAESRV